MRSTTTLKWPRRASKWHEIFNFLLGTPGQGGKYFEVFCKHFLLTNPRLCRDYRNVWLSREVPARVRAALNLPRNEHGYDLVVETLGGKFGIVQCKFTGDQTKTLHWTGTNLSSWLAVSSKADVRILFTNASGIDAVTRSKAQEKDFSEISLSHLLELTTDDINRVINSIHGVVSRAQRFKPRRHQREAIAHVVRGFKKSARGKLILPCGAGKTLTALWIKEQVRPARTLVLVPSLALLRQFKNDWKAQERSYSTCLCVCSEQDIDKGSDSTEAHISQLNARVTTDPKTIRQFLKANKNCVVYSTYQSSPQLAAALKGTGARFDFAVFDEAHRTAGDRRGSSFSTALDEKKVPIKRRLFMTATPRVVSELVKNRLGEKYLQYLADMNDQDTYGPEFYRLSFAKAIERKILVDYKIMAIGVSNTEIQQLVHQRAYTENATADEIANNYALRKVMARHKLSHAVTFHSSVSRAKQFEERHRSLFRSVASFHVNGSQSTNERADLLSQFREAPASVITNARCLTEGIDVPIIDCVYFCDPRQSKIDIVQASGRALRVDKTKKKKFGYIVVPIFHSRETELEESIESGVFKNLIAVVRALADQDERIEEEIKNIAFGDGLRRAADGRIQINFESAKLIRLEGIEKELAKAIFAQVVQRAVLPWRPFEQARQFVHGLKLQNAPSWSDYCAGRMPNLPPRPSDVPSNPSSYYRGKGWKSWGDWLGTGYVANYAREYRPFNAARKFVHGLQLKSTVEWREYCFGNRPDLPLRPDDIPSNPRQVYKSDGWKTMGDWLGTGTIAPFLREYRSLADARAFIHKLHFRSYVEWKNYCKGKRPDLPPKPEDIPAQPYRAYKNDGWISMGDFLGTGNVANYLRKYRSFSEARAFAHSLKLKGQKEWATYCKGQRPELPPKPTDIPGNPAGTYKDAGWVNMGDWLGTGFISPRLRKYRPFKEARAFVHSLNLKSVAEWNAYRVGKTSHRVKKPDDIPSNPNLTYKNSGFKGMGDWLGTGNIAPRLRTYRSFEEARAFVHKLNLKSRANWQAYCAGQTSGLPRLPMDIPTNPQRTYKKTGWKGMGDWLGTGKVADQLRQYRNFERARKFARSLKLKSGAEWRAYCKGLRPSLTAKPKDIPANPNQTYRNRGWKGMGDWLGTGRVADQLREFRDFGEARAFVHRLKLKSAAEWSAYCKGEIPNLPPKPNDIPVAVYQKYKNLGWKGMGDWLGTGSVAPRDRNYLSFHSARAFVRKLRLQSSAEWAAYCKGKRVDLPPKPAKIPASPGRTYGGDGWNGMGDWLGTGRVANFDRQYRQFDDARSFARSLNLKSTSEWREYCKGLRPHLPKKPDDIPAVPYQTYKYDGWKGMGDWLGTGAVAPNLRKYRAFEEARSFAHKLKLNSMREWLAYCNGQRPDLPKKPDDIPASPEWCYRKSGWKNAGDWLGTGNVATYERKYRPFEDARKFARSLRLKSRNEWLRYCKKGMPGLPQKPADISTIPDSTYKGKGWKDWRDWLGSDGLPRRREYRPFTDARAFAHTLKLKSATQWTAYCAGRIIDLPKRPEDIPASPEWCYKKSGWLGWGDWLGTGTVATRLRK